MFTRAIAAVVPAAVVTLTTLYVMQSLIVSGAEAIRPHESAAESTFFIVDTTAAAEPDTPKPERPPRPASRPTTVPASLESQTDAVLSASVTAPRFLPGATLANGTASIGDSDFIPISRALEYPAQAAVRNLEGYVVIRYTVTSTGRVRDIHVLESTAMLFESSAIKAALDFRYKPRVVGGEAVDVTGVTNRIVFTLNDPVPDPNAGQPIMEL